MVKTPTVAPRSAMQSILLNELRPRSLRFRLRQVLSILYLELKQVRCRTRRIAICKHLRTKPVGWLFSLATCYRSSDHSQKYLTNCELNTWLPTIRLTRLTTATSARLTSSLVQVGAI